METPTDFTGISWLRFLIAATTVIGLMGLLSWSLRAVANRGWIATVADKSRRLRLIETLSLDTRHRLVIIRCDEAEHLLLLGASQDTVVASDLPVPQISSSATTTPVDS
jgi:flagellar protein FliO/FliZ